MRRTPPPRDIRRAGLAAEEGVAFVAAKDAELIREAAAGKDLALPLIDAVAAQLARATELGHGGEHMAATYRASEPGHG